MKNIEELMDLFHPDAVEVHVFKANGQWNATLMLDSETLIGDDNEGNELPVTVAADTMQGALDELNKLCKEVC